MKRVRHSYSLLVAFSVAFILNVAFTAVPAFADHVAMEVNKDNDHAWKVHVVGDDGPNSVTFVSGPAGCSGTVAMTPSPPLGTGSVRFFVVETDADANDAAELRSSRFAGTRLDDLISLEYWACATQNNGQQWPYIILNIDWNGDNITDDLIFFEPAYQHPLAGNPNVFECPSQSQVVLTSADWGKWHHWDARNGCWWSLEDVDGDTTFSGANATPGTGVKPLRTYIAAQPDARIINADGNLGGVRIAQGFGDAATYEGFVDRVEIATKKIIYDMDDP
jgi:hypothetical protein